MKDYDSRAALEYYRSHLEEKMEYVPVSSLGAKLTIDGNQFCWLLGDNLQSGVAGFGDTARAAMLDFNVNLHGQTIPSRAERTKP